MTNTYAQQAAAIRELVRLAEGNPDEGPSVQTLELVAEVVWLLENVAADEPAAV